MAHYITDLFFSCNIYSLVLYIFFRRKIFPKSIDCEKMCIFAMLMGEIHRRKKAFCFKSQFVNSPKFYQRTKTINAHSVYIPSMCVLRIGYVYIPRRGNIVSSLFIWSRRLAMPQFCGRKATSLTSFLYLYTMLFCSY